MSKDVTFLPKLLYHLVPKKFFVEFTDSNGSYDCRNKEEWGSNSPFIHTSPSKKQLKEKVADINWANYPIQEKFVLLEIKAQDIKAKVTCAVIKDCVYHHIWGKLPKDLFRVFKVDRSEDGRFLI
ncbi:hypothetical protein CL632_02390 [bacterium]|jgi:uncharacterized protein (DUF952 family)|nr:hypothetical protein [bacterium]